MSEPAIVDFFAKQEAECQQAFRGLPIGSSHENYQAVHYTLLALERLKNSLVNYIESGRIEEEKSPGKNEPSI